MKEVERSKILKYELGGISVYNTHDAGQTVPYNNDVIIIN